MNEKNGKSRSDFPSQIEETRFPDFPPPSYSPLAIAFCLFAESQNPDSWQTGPSQGPVARCYKEQLPVVRSIYGVL